MKTNASSLLLLLLFTTPVFPAGNLRINLLAGPSLSVSENNKFNLGYSGLVSFDSKLTNRSSLGLGAGFNYVETNKDYEVDTNFNYVPSVNGCYCRYYNSSFSSFNIYVPLRYKFKAMDRGRHEGHLSAGIDAFVWERSGGNYSYYRRDQNNQLHMGPFYVEYLKKKEVAVFLNKAVSVQYSFALKGKKRLACELSYSFGKQKRILGMLVGLSFGN